jgi:hypothetical protein
MSGHQPHEPSAEDVSAAIADRAVVDQAKGYLAQTSGLSVEDAAWLLESVSQKRRITPAAVAAAVMDLADGPPGAPGADRTHQVAGWVLALAGMSGAGRRS